MEETDEFMDNDTGDFLSGLPEIKDLITQNNFGSMNLQSTCSA